MIERQQPVEEHQLGVGQLQIILRMLADLFQLPHHVVGKISNRSRGERRQSRHARRAMLAQQPLHHLKNVFLHYFAPAPALDLNLPCRALTRM